jgi:hypothetical protein
MNRSVTFKSRLFANKEPQPHFINPRCFGEDLAAWLIERLGSAPWSLSEPIQEDYGWGFWATIGSNKYWTAIGILDEAIGSEVGEWCVTVAYNPGFNLIRRLFHRPSPDELLTLCAAIDQALQQEPGVTEIEWETDEPQAGRSGAHPEAPSGAGPAA